MAVIKLEVPLAKKTAISFFDIPVDSDALNEHILINGVLFNLSYSEQTASILLKPVDDSKINVLTLNLPTCNFCPCHGKLYKYIPGQSAPVLVCVHCF